MEHPASVEVEIPRHEIDRRLAAVRQRMADRGLEALIVFSSPGHLRFGQRGHVLYLSGYEPYFGDCMMLLPLDPAIDARLVKDAANHFPEGCTWIEDVRAAGDRVKVVRDFLSDHGLERSAVGVAGEYSVGPALYQRLLEEVGPARLEMASDLLEQERSVKSAYELECLRGAAAIAGRGLEAAARFMRPGVNESDVKGELERVCRAHGSQAFPHYTMVVSGRDEEYTSRWWHCERRGSIRRSGVHRLRHDVPRVLLRHLAAVRARQGVRPAEGRAQGPAGGAPGRRRGGAAGCQRVDRPSGSRQDPDGRLGDRDWWGIGHGVGLEVHEWPFIGYQRIVDDRAYEDRVLEEDMVISLEPTMALPDAGDFQIEDQFVVKQEGAVRLNDVSHEITEV